MAPPVLEEAPHCCELLGRAGHQADMLEASNHPLPTMDFRGHD